MIIFALFCILVNEDKYTGTCTIMNRAIIITTDGSHSISIPEQAITYHSVHGAIQESMHVFIESGLRQKSAGAESVAILEMGFGTGLNALLTIAEAEKNKQAMYYETIELFPLEKSITSQLNYCEQLKRPDLQPLFELIHNSSWNESIEISPYFSFKKNKTGLPEYFSRQLFDVIYFDAFAPEVQPELWTAEIFQKLYGLMKPRAVLTTYCSKSIVRKAMTNAGLKVEKIPGPPHKREMVRAIREK